MPALAWVYNATYSLQKKYVLSASYNRSLNFINRLLVLEGTTVKSFSANLGDQQRADVAASMPLKPAGFWSVQVFTDVSFTQYPISMSNGLKQLAQWSNNTALQQSFVFPKRWEATINASYYSSELIGIYRTCPAGFIDAGIRRTFFNSRLIAQLNCNEIFNTNRYKASSKTDIVDYHYNDKPYNRRLSLSLTYHLAGNTLKGNTRKTEEQERP